MVHKSLDQQILYLSKNNKNLKQNMNFDLQTYFNMKIMFNGLDRPFDNLRYERNAR
jgi:hypothetical protein